MQFLPDGTVKIKNNNTGEEKIVKPDELPTYGISYQKYQDEYNAYNEMQGGAPAVVRNQQAQEKLKLTTSAESAKNVLDVLASRAGGILSDEQYKAAIQGAVSDYNSKRAFGEGGKNVTNTERVLLGGQLVNLNEVRPNIFQRIGAWFTGEQPATTSKIGEDEASIREKMIQAILRANPNTDVSGYQNINVPSIKKNTDNTASDFWQTSQGEKMNLKPAGMLENKVNDVLDIAKGTLQLPAILSSSVPVIGLNVPKDPIAGAKVIADMGKGMLKSLADTIGINKNTIGIGEDGHFYWNPGQQVKDALIHDYQHPIDTALWILPFLKELNKLKGGEGIINQAAKEAPVTEKALIEKSTETVKNVGGLPQIPNAKAGKAARDVATIVPESVIKSEEIMSKVLQNTKSNSIVGMAKELETSIPKNATKIENWAKSVDTKIGAQPVGEIVNQVIEKVKNTSAAQANPDLVNIVTKDLQKQLTTGQLVGGMTRGEIESTTFTAINNARKYFTSNLDSWFNNGMPVGSPTNDLNAMKWATANGLKDVIAEADTAGVVKQALDAQHIAFEASPVLSKLAQKAGTKVGSIGYKWGLTRKAWEETGGKLMEQVKISNARKLQGVLPEIPTSPVIPPETIVSGQNVGTLPEIKSAQPFPLPENIINTVIEGKGPAQAERLVRDMRYKQGSWMPRITQNEFLKEASKKKYK